MYGLNEKQFRNLFDKASKIKGISGENFMVLLESRLDNLVYRLGFSNSRAGARQLVAHGHVTVNGKKVDIASYTVSTCDVIALRERSKGLSTVKEAFANRNHFQLMLNSMKQLWKVNSFVFQNVPSCHKKLTKTNCRVLQPIIKATPLGISLRGLFFYHA